MSGSAPHRVTRMPRQHLTQTAIDYITDDWQRYGRYAVARTRRRDPVAYVRIVASLLPKTVLLGISQRRTVRLDFRGIEAREDNWADGDEYPPVSPQEAREALDHGEDAP